MVNGYRVALTHRTGKASLAYCGVNRLSRKLMSLMSFSQKVNHEQQGWKIFNTENTVGPGRIPSPVSWRLMLPVSFKERCAVYVSGDGDFLIGLVGAAGKPALFPVPPGN